jgi:uncharacterized protein
METTQEQFKKLAPAAGKCMFLATGLLTAAMILPVLICWFIFQGQNVVFPLWANIGFVAWGILWLAYLLISPPIRYRRYRYLIDQEKIVVKEGLWFTTIEFAPIERVHQIAVKSGPIDRLFGLANVIATTAGGTITIRFLEKEQAEEIAINLQAKVRYILERQGISLAELTPEKKNGCGTSATHGEDADE